MKKLMTCSTLSLLFGLIQTAQAQSPAPSGRVVDVEKNGIIAVSVQGTLTCRNPLIPGETKYPVSATTNADGFYTLNFPPVASTSSCLNSSLAVSFSKTGYTFFDNVGIEEPLFQSVSAADYKPVAASEMIAAGFSVGLAQTTEAAASVPLPPTLAGRSVVISQAVGDEKTAELFYVSPTQINYIIPPGLAIGRAYVKVREGNRLVRAGVIEIRPVAPSLFTLTSDSSALPAAFAQRIKPDGTVLYEPIARFDQEQGGFVAVPIDLYTDTDRVFLGLLGTGIRNRRALEAVVAKIGGTPVEALYAGPQGGLPGIDQINLPVPRELAGRGPVDVEILVEGIVVNLVKVVIK
jgi:uncharacterized protein (TIGR03437 family)